MDRAARTSILTVDDDPVVSRAVARDLRRRYGSTHRIAAPNPASRPSRHCARTHCAARFSRPLSHGAAVASQAYADTSAAIDAIYVVDLDCYLLKPWDRPRRSSAPSSTRSSRRGPAPFPSRARDVDRNAGARRRGVVEGGGPLAARGRRREDAIDDWPDDWLDDHGATNSHDLSATFVQSGLDGARLDRTADVVGADMLEGALRWLGYTLETEHLMNEIEDSSNRISVLVGAARQYSQMDRAPNQVLDVHELLDSTLIMLSRRIGDVKVVKDYDRTMPKIDV